MTNEIRDYIYLDTGRAGSLYAQASGGLTERITMSDHEHEKLNDIEKGLPLSRSEISKEILLGSQQVETRVLHDYLFNELEELLAKRIIDISPKTVALVKPGSLIRITGLAELDDSQRMLEIMSNYNRFIRLINLAPHSQAIQEHKWALEAELTQPHNSNEIKRIQRELDQLSVDALGRELKIGVPEITVEAIHLYYQLLYKDIFEIKIRPTDLNTYVSRAIVNRENFRDTSAMIYAKYGSRTQVQWTMVGQVTTIIAPAKIGDTDKQTQEKIVSHLQQQNISVDIHEEESQKPQNDDSAKGNEETTDIPANLRDHLEALFEALYEMEKFTVVSGNKTTWNVSPIAIYHVIP